MGNGERPDFAIEVISPRVATAGWGEIRYAEVPDSGPGISHEIVRRATGRNSGSTSAGATRLNRDPGRMAEHYFRTESIALAHLGAKPIGCGSKDFAWIPLIRRRNPTGKP